jgi:hypothetical protein
MGMFSKLSEKNGDSACTKDTLSRSFYPSCMNGVFVLHLKGCVLPLNLCDNETGKVVAFSFELDRLRVSPYRSPTSD